jgi:putative DNA primase/helicase
MSAVTPFVREETKRDAADADERARTRTAISGEQVPEITDTDLANARRLAARYGADLRFTPERGWLTWDGRRWAIDEKGVQLQARAKETAESIYDEVRNALDKKATFQHAKRSQSKSAIEAMTWLARSEPGIPSRLAPLGVVHRSGPSRARPR